MNHASLFSGIGGFDLAAEWMGWENVFHCEWNPFCKKILNYYWPNAVSYDDITKTDFTIWRGRIDVLTGGFPCQPYSVAGKRKGKDDERHLWPQMLRAIREIQPRWIMGENVLGLVNWNAGLVFEEVQADLEAEGYEVQPYVLPAAGVNAPHKRDRVWFVAYRANTGNETMCRSEINTDGFKPVTYTACQQSKRYQFTRQRKISQQKQRQFRRSNCENVITNAHIKRCNNGRNHWKKRHFQSYQRFTQKNQSKRKRWQCRACTFSSIITNANSRRQSCKKYRKTKSGFFTKASIPNNWQNFPTQSPVCNGNDGISARLDTNTILESVGRKVNKSFKSYNFWRNESIKAGGNAVVPQVVLQIFKSIQEYQDNYA